MQKRKRGFDDKYERISLDDLQALQESFANMQVVDLRMNTGDIGNQSLIPRNTAQIPPAVAAESTGSNQDTHMPHSADFTAGEGSRAIPSA